MRQEMRNATAEERRRLQRRQRIEGRDALNDLGIAWLQRAADPRYAAYEKFVLFLQDIFVVAPPKVRNPAMLYQHQQLLRALGKERYPDLCKAVTRSPAMVVYLDLQQSRIGQPNENFARELFELFTLGEGNYTEKDVKEAARAFTGYGQNQGEFVFRPRAHDRGRKTVFGITGIDTGDDVIDAIYRTEAAADFLPRELIRFYLTDRPLPADYVTALGRQWRRDSFDTGKLLERFFASRLFFDPTLRSDLIKSPTQFYVGLLHDLELDVAPIPRFTLNFLRQMGQPFFTPPNVRGWVGGQLWINSSTLAARRACVEFALTPLNRDRLNADEQQDLAAAETRSGSPLQLTVSDTFLARLAALDPADAVGTILDQLFPLALDDSFREAVTEQFSAARRAPGEHHAGLRQFLSLLLQSPQYHLC